MWLLVPELRTIERDFSSPLLKKMIASHRMKMSNPPATCILDYNVFKSSFFFVLNSRIAKPHLPPSSIITADLPLCAVLDYFKTKRERRKYHKFQETGKGTLWQITSDIVYVWISFQHKGEMLQRNLPPTGPTNDLCLLSVKIDSLPPSPLPMK